MYLWRAETSQQPISQTTWLKVTFHCNHCCFCVFAAMGVTSTKPGQLLHTSHSEHKVLHLDKPLKTEAQQSVQLYLTTFSTPTCPCHQPETRAVSHPCNPCNPCPCQGRRRKKAAIIGRPKKPKRARHRKTCRYIGE